MERECLILRSVRYSDNDRVVTFFSKDEGLLTGFARGANGPGNRFGASLEPLTWSYFIGRHHLDGTLYRIHKASVIDCFIALREDLERMYWAGAAVRLLLSLLPPQHPEQPLFDSMIRYLKDLESERPSPPLSWLRFASLALVFLGYGIQSGSCHRCHDDLSGRTVTYHIPDGKILCRQCGGVDGKKDGIRTETDVLSLLERWGKNEDVRETVPAELIDSAISLVDSVFGHHIQNWIPVRSLPVSLG